MRTVLFYQVLCALLFFSFEWGYAQQKKQKYTISGYVTEKGSRESLVGVNVYIPALKSGTTSNNYGFYSISLPQGKYQVLYSFVGYEVVTKEIVLSEDVQMDVQIQSGIELEEVVVSAARTERLSKTSQMSEVKIPIGQIKQVPTLLGEKDVLKTLQLMPGVQSGTEGSSGIYVRGGGPDQNLLILDDAPVYNANHLFGFFSIFNGDALKSVSLTKGGFPARYGGRLSSVLEMNMKDGSKEEFGGEAGIGLIASRLIIEAPIVKDKASFIVSGRRTYLDLLMKPAMPKDEKVGYYFYDLNAKVNYDFGRKDKLYLSGYFGRDRFSFESREDGFDSEGGLFWGNATGTLRWNHLFSDKIFSNTSFIFSDYTFSIFQKDRMSNVDYELEYSSGIKDIGLKYDMQWSLSPSYSIRTGFASTFHRFKPSAIVVKDTSVNRVEKKVKTIPVVESGAYVENELKIKERLRMNIGLRFSHYYHEKKSYMALEPRFSAGYSFGNNMSVKASYARMRQYVHLLTSTGINLPLDLWVPSTDLVKPQHSEQYALGVAKDFVEKNFSLSLEGYYKKMDNIVGYAPGSNFMLVDDDFENIDNFSWEENLIRGQGWSYGIEFLLQRKIGRLSGWIGYTLSWTQHQFDEDNRGEKYYARYDRRHDISIVGIYKLTPHITLSGTWVYGTGNAVTLPEAEFSAKNYYMDRFKAKEYGSKNDFRMRAYHRMDIAIQFHKKKKNRERTWEIGLYNAYSRKNPFFYQITEKQIYDATTGVNRNKNILEQISLFPIIPSITYTLKF